MSWISISHLHSFRESLAHHPKSGYVDFYIINTRGYHIHTPCWHLKGESKKRMENILASKWEIWVLIFLHIDFLGPTVHTLFWKDFLFRSRFYEVPSQGRIVYHRKAQAGESVGHYDQRHSLVGFLMLLPLLVFPFYFSLYNESRGWQKKRKVFGPCWQILHGLS
jgi:hypothetical protein